MNCDYYDGNINNGGSTSSHARDVLDSASLGDDDAESAGDSVADKKKKRKASGDVKRIKKKEEVKDDDTEALRKKIGTCSRWIYLNPVR